MRFFILISYNGSAYCGWQRQKNGISVQEQLEKAFSVFLRESTEITGAGRTDSGVHAINYHAHFDSANPVLLKDPLKIIYKINAILPPDIVIHDICQVNNDSHSRFDAISRTYRYYVHTFKDPFAAGYSYFFPYSLNIDAMNKAASYLTGERDFTSMAKLHSETKTNICNVTEAIWTPGDPVNLHPESNGRFCFTITANRFLRNMVRAVVGSLLEVGRERKSPEWIIEVLNEKERGAAGNSVPAHALFFTEINYPYKVF